jgi:hypothetical protein
MVDSAYTSLDQLKEYMDIWDANEGFTYASSNLIVSLMDYAFRTEAEYKLNAMYPTLSGTKYIDIVWYQLGYYRDGMSLDESYEQAVTTWSGQEDDTVPTL